MYDMAHPLVSNCRVRSECTIMKTNPPARAVVIKIKREYFQGLRLRKGGTRNSFILSSGD